MSGSRWMRILGSSGFFSRSKITASDSLASTKTPRKANLRFLEHDPEKWEPVFRKDHAQTKIVFSGRDAGERKHGVHQHVGARGAIGLRRVFQFVVADAVLARDKYHRGGYARIQVAGI